MQDRIAMHNRNKLKLGLFGANCSNGRAMTTELAFVASNVEGGVVPDSGHWIMEENPKATTAMILDFLNK